MSITEVTARDMVDRWMEEPSELLAFFIHLLWISKIDPDKPLTWNVKNGEISFMGDVVNRD